MSSRNEIKGSNIVQNSGGTNTSTSDSFTGSTESTAGVKGLVPAPAAADNELGKFLNANGTFETPGDPRKRIIYYEDFLFGGTSTSTWNNTSTGTAANINNSGSGTSANTWGVLGCQTGSTSTGRGSGRGGVMRFGDPGEGTVFCAVRVSVTDLSTVSEEFTLDVGVHDQVSTSSTPTEGIYFVYDRLTSANWLAVNANSSTLTTTDTGVAVTAATFVTLSWTINSANTEIKFYIDGTLAATHTTNIPSGVSNLNPTIRMIKSAGTTARNALMDYFYVHNTPDTR